MIEWRGRPPERAAVFDLDGTITRIDTYVHFLIAVMRRHPLRALRSIWLPLAVAAHKIGLRDNSWLKRIFLGSIVGGMRRDALEAIVSPFVDEVMARHIRPGALEALRGHLAAGDRVLLATASLDFYVAALAAKLRVRDIVCTGSVWIGDRLVAELRPRNCYGAEKLRRVVGLLGDGAKRPYVYVYTDHHSDTALLDWANEGIAVNPDPRLRVHCELKGSPIVDWELNK